jgi:hypothetical protein
MYSARQILRGIRHPNLAVRQFNQFYHTRGGRRSYNTDGINVFDEDWDNLLILDAFRYDTFAELIGEYHIEGRLESRISGGAATPEFLRANVDGRDLRDTVYVTATTMLYREGPLTDELDIDLFEIEDVWQDTIDYGEFAVAPETMSDRAFGVLDRHPGKRLVVHYLQPHIPFIGETGQEKLAEAGEEVWNLAMEGKLGHGDDDLWEAYLENARIVLEEVASVVDELDGKTVVTADHGQMLGDRAGPVPIKEYGHPLGLYTEELVKVPWFVCDHDERRETVADRPEDDYETRDRDEIDEKAREHLEQLGYLS